MVPPLLLKPTCICACLEPKRSAKGFNYKEDDRALPVWELLLFCCRSDTRAPSFWRSEWPETWPGWRLSWMPCISDTVYDIGLSSRQSR